MTKPVQPAQHETPRYYMGSRLFAAALVVVGTVVAMESRWGDSIRPSALVLGAIGAGILMMLTGPRPAPRSLQAAYLPHEADPDEPEFMPVPWWRPVVYPAAMIIGLLVLLVIAIAVRP